MTTSTGSKRGLRLVALLLVGALAGCSESPPVRYHALSVAPTETEPMPSGRARVLVEILPIAVPDRLDRPQLVLSAPSAGRVEVLDDDRWVAPLSAEVRQAVADRLWRGLRAVDVYNAPAPAGTEADGPARYRLALRIERFDAIVGNRTAVEATWTLRRLPRGAQTTCRISVSSPLAANDVQATETAVSTLGKDLGRMGDAIATSLRGLEEGRPMSCPE